MKSCGREHDASRPSSISSEIQSLHQSSRSIDSEVLDQKFGMQFYHWENCIPPVKYDVRKIWRKGPKQNTQTSYNAIRQVYQNLQLNEGDFVYDLGSGYGRFLLYGACLFPAVTFTGVELVTERVLETERLARNAGLLNVRVINDHVLNVDLSNGSIFYLHNPFPHLMRKVLDQLRYSACCKKITIVTNGRTTRDVARIPWLIWIKSLDSDLLALYESV